MRTCLTTNRGLVGFAPALVGERGGLSSRALTFAVGAADGACGSPRRQERPPLGSVGGPLHCPSGVCALCPRAVGQGATLDVCVTRQTRMRRPVRGVGFG